MNTLQAVGVPAHAVQDSAACFADPQLQHRNHFVELALTQPRDSRSLRAHGSCSAELRRAARRSPRPWAPTTMPVLRDLLGYTDEQIVELVASGALQ